jgi:hypothetical protein
MPPPEIGDLLNMIMDHAGHQSVHCAAGNRVDSEVDCWKNKTFTCFILFLSSFS